MLVDCESTGAFGRSSEETLAPTCPGTDGGDVIDCTDDDCPAPAFANAFKSAVCGGTCDDDPAGSKEFRFPCKAAWYKAGGKAEEVPPAAVTAVPGGAFAWVICWTAEAATAAIVAAAFDIMKAALWSTGANVCEPAIAAR